MKMFVLSIHVPKVLLFFPERTQRDMRFNRLLTTPFDVVASVNQAM